MNHEKGYSEHCVSRQHKLDTWFPGGWVWEAIDAKIKLLHKEKPEAFDYFIGDSSGYDDDDRQGPLWIRPNSLSNTTNTQITQVFGHTRIASCQNLLEV